MSRNAPASIDARVKAWRTLVKPMKRVGITLLDQQFWCWGYDIRTEGNLLLRYGSEQFRQDKSCGGTVYTIVTGTHAQLRLWGGTLLYRHDAAIIHLKRYEFEPRLVSEEQSWSYGLPTNSAFPASPEACTTAALLASACMRWIAGYERWVTELLGVAHRERSIAAWSEKALVQVDAAQMAVLWEQYAAAFASFSLSTSDTNSLSNH